MERASIFAQNKGINIDNGIYKGLKSSRVFTEENLGTVDRSWVETIENQALAMTWDAKQKELTVFSALCTHQDCPIKESSEMDRMVFTVIAMEDI